MQGSVICSSRTDNYIDVTYFANCSAPLKYVWKNLSCRFMFLAVEEPTSFFLLRSLSSFVPSCTLSSLMSSSMRWWNRWFQHLSIVLPKFTVQRRPSLASWCSTKSTIRSICTKGWWSRWFHWHLWSLSHNSDRAFIPEPCYLKPVWSPVLFSYGCFVRHELPHQHTSFINLSEWSMWKGAQRL